MVALAPNDQPGVTVDADAVAAPSASTVVVEAGPVRREVDVAASGPLTIGRADDATLSIDDERISRRHLTVSWQDDALVMRDLGSRNGTFVNSRRVIGERRLRGGDVVSAGPVRILVGGTPPPEALLDEGELSIVWTRSWSARAAFAGRSGSRVSCSRARRRPSPRHRARRRSAAPPIPSASTRRVA